MPSTFLPVRYWNVCLWQFFVCFKAFTTFWYDTKKNFMHFSESGTFTRPEDWWERKLLVVRFFYLFSMSGRPLSSSTQKKRVVVLCSRLQFHVVVGQRRQRNKQNSVTHVQSSCFANLTLLLFCRSCCRRCRRCLRWLNTVLRAVSGNSRDGECFELNKQTWRRKSNGTQETISLNLLIEILWYLAEFSL